MDGGALASGFPVNNTPTNSLAAIEDSTHLNNLNKQNMISNLMIEQILIKWVRFLLTIKLKQKLVYISSLISKTFIIEKL
ncbi:hypothetical protein NF27_DC00100 [Candidatus Jidaibacter acanthamoeba]|uniref:Uncharacterized protein n=1 Tax=Candidatus Jidaibacter acanthamoebae TaxID=86105 RepID=A0A0C1N090_9RICK|nr:hypothetical protein [Candidatus Jidaibacter acanthamoeba]KIE05731.1 hypothetical protein NF27_DC00100 [Candidatus Jidaibacter acanthamoeba]